MGTKILITGGSGMIGQAVSAALSENGHQISHLSRNPLRTLITLLINGILPINILTQMR